MSTITCPKDHVHRAVLLHRAPDAQLAVVVKTPALDVAPSHEHARVDPCGGNGEGNDAWCVCVRARAPK
jgi:hypothetical protein